ncbi:MAG: hypothetical protein OWT28_02465 [Firmicutes bacterium]|nr:hypothetical protein [Bacillota bacterium]
MNNRIIISSCVIAAGITLIAYSNSFAAEDAQQAQVPVLKHAVEPQSRVPAWFLHDVQLAERANPTVGANYMLNYDETSVPFGPQMNQVWYGALSNHGKNGAFGYSWTGVYQQVKQVTVQPLSAISVLEQSRQGKTTVGLLVPAISEDIYNGDFLAFSNGQAIIATNKSGTLYYSVYPVKGVSVPSSNFGYGSTAPGLSDVKNNTIAQQSSSNPLFKTTLKLPNGKLVKPDESVRWKDLSIQLSIASLPPSTKNGYLEVIGNHSTVISHERVSTSAGPATLVLNKRTQPAASKSNAVTYEYWVIVNGSQYSYAIDATVIGNLKKSKSEVMQLLQEWKVPH